MFVHFISSKSDFTAGIVHDNLYNRLYTMWIYYINIFFLLITLKDSKNYVISLKLYIIIF